MNVSCCGFGDGDGGREEWEMEGAEEKGRNVLDNLRSNDLAGSAPGRKGIEDDDLVVFEGGLEFGLAMRGRKSMLAFVHPSIT